MATARLIVTALNPEETGNDSQTFSNINPDLLRGAGQSDYTNAQKIISGMTGIINTLTDDTYDHTDYQVSYSVNEEIEE